MKHGISPAQLIRLLQVLNPIMMALSETPKPDSVRSTIVEDIHEGGAKRYVVVLKAAYTKREDAEKLLQLDEMIDKV